MELPAGRFRILIMNLNTEQGYLEEAHLAFDHALGDGTFKYSKLASGYVKEQLPLCISCTREIIGPGRLYSSIYHLEAHTHFLQILYEKVNE